MSTALPILRYTNYCLADFGVSTASEPGCGNVPGNVHWNSSALIAVVVIIREYTF